MINKILDLKKYDLLLLTISEESNTNGGYWWLAFIEYAWELKYDNSMKQGYDAASSLLLNNKYKK